MNTLVDFFIVLWIKFIIEFKRKPFGITYNNKIYFNRKVAKTLRKNMEGKL